MPTNPKLLASGELSDNLALICYPTGDVKYQRISFFSLCNTQCEPALINIEYMVSSAGKLNAKMVHNMELLEGSIFQVISDGAQLVLGKTNGLKASSSAGGVTYVITGEEET